MPFCFRCNTEDVKKDADHKAWCPVVKEKREKGRQIANIAEGYRRKNLTVDPGSHGNINRPGKCKKCGVVVKSLLTHIGSCKGPAA